MLLREHDQQWKPLNRIDHAVREPIHAGAVRTQIRVRTYFSAETMRTARQRTETKLDPLYLFGCAVLWLKQGDADAGWELVRGLKASESTARIAETLLAQTANLELEVRDWGRATIDSDTPIPETGLEILDVSKAAATMNTPNTPYGLEIIENCVTCKLRKDKWFCGLSPGVLKLFSESSHLSTYPGGAVLFVEGQMPRGGLV